MIDLDRAEALAIHAALEKMLTQKYFSICAIDEVASILGKYPGGRAYKILRALHCVDYAQMDAELRGQIPDLISEALSIEKIKVPSVMKHFVDAAPVKPKTAIHRLMGR